MSYSVKVRTHRGVRTTYQGDSFKAAFNVMVKENAMAIVVNSSGRIMATNLARTV